MIQLFIDSSHKDEVSVMLKGEFGEEVLKTEAKNIKGSQIILSSIESLLIKKRKSLTDISEVHVYMGPGSYTGRRVGAAIANALSYSLQIPINGKKGEFVYPTYE